VTSFGPGGSLLPLSTATYMCILGLFLRTAASIAFCISCLDPCTTYLVRAAPRSYQKATTTRFELVPSKRISYRVDDSRLTR
jgi:hypothetical protein